MGNFQKQRTLTPDGHFITETVYVPTKTIINAAQLFEAMGFKYAEYDTEIVYKNNERDLVIVFDLAKRTFSIEHGGLYSYPILSMSILRAINMQCEELGWI